MAAPPAPGRSGQLLPEGFRFGAVDAATAEVVEADEWRSEASAAPVRVVASDGDPHDWLGLPAPIEFAERIEAEGTCIVLPELNGLAVDAFVRQRLETGFLVRALDNLLTAAVLAARKLKAEGVRVELSLRASNEYETERLLADLVMLHADGIDRAHLHEHLVARREEWYRRDPAGARTALRRRLSASVIPLEKAFPRAIAAVLDSPGVVFDAVELTWRHRPPDPAKLTAGLLSRAGRLPVIVADPGSTGWNTARHLRTHLGAVIDAVAAGAPIEGYRWLAPDDTSSTYRRLIKALRAGDATALAA